LASSLRQIPDDDRTKKKVVHVSFANDVGQDAGGLKRQWSAFVADSLVNSSSSSSTATTTTSYLKPPPSPPLMRCWEEGCTVFDVNYEYYQWWKDNRRDLGVEEVDVERTYRKLGMIIGLCLIEGLQLIRISRFLCKNLLSLPPPSPSSETKYSNDNEEDEEEDDTINNDDEDSDDEDDNDNYKSIYLWNQRCKDVRRIKWEDFKELCPRKATYMKDPAQRQYCDFESTTLPCVDNSNSVNNSSSGQSIYSTSVIRRCVPTDFFTISTGYNDNEFHPPADPDDALYDKLAESILQNEHVNVLRSNIVQGFQRIVDPKVLRSLFDPDEIQHLLTPSAYIQINDWKKHTLYNRCSLSDDVVRLFWYVIKNKLNQDEKQGLCEFATGQPKPPSGGFVELDPLFTITVVDCGGDENGDQSTGGASSSISAHTCVNQIVLPSTITNEEQMTLLLKGAVQRKKGEFFNKR